MLSRGVIWFIFVVLVLGPIGLAMGAEQVDSETGHQSESPNIFDGDWITVVLTIGVFIVLLAVLGKWAWSPILLGLQKREEYIRQSIEEAENSRSEAEKALQAYRDKLAKGRAEADKIIAKGRVDAAELSRELKEAAREEVRKLHYQTQRDISRAKDEAVQEIHNQVAQIATELAGKIISKTISPQEHHNLIQESLNKLQNNNQAK